VFCYGSYYEIRYFIAVYCTKPNSAGVHFQHTARKTTLLAREKTNSAHYKEMTGHDFPPKVIRTESENKEKYSLLKIQAEFGISSVFAAINILKVGLRCFIAMAREPIIIWRSSLPPNSQSMRR